MRRTDMRRADKRRRPGKCPGAPFRGFRRLYLLAAMLLLVSVSLCGCGAASGGSTSDSSASDVSSSGSGEETSSESLTGSGSEDAAGSGDTANTASVANDYYLDLSDLGMNLTIYLHLDEDETFQFSNTLSFETVKSGGTYVESDGEYLMVFDSINGEDYSVSDGYTSSFVVTEDGSLDFSAGQYVYYGSTHIMTVSEDDETIKLAGVVVPDDYDEPDTSSEFQTGSYACEDVTEGDVVYSHVITFYEDETYLLVTSYETADGLGMAYEMGEYGVSTTQLALEPEDADRVSCEIADADNLTVSILPYPGAEERETFSFTRIEEADLLAELSGEGTVTGSDETFAVTVKLYADGSYESLAEDFTEYGVLTIDTSNGYMKQYPDHPETGVRGLNQITTVPAGSCSFENGSFTLSGLRVRKSSGLTRYETTVSEE
ncbi:MAG: hypothetical protein LUI87_18855 [Lachnospiraceae bacterium]|nr:hypothetical protein [Lachnospiraceae bacterium]